jgi:hypothetical protein
VSKACTPTLRELLASTVGRHEHRYQIVREREPVLEPFATASSLHEALSPKSKLGSSARQALLRVVVLEYRRDQHPLWHALAVQALEPMLAGLRARMRRGTAEEREQEVQVALVEALVRLRLGRVGGPVFPLLTLRRAIGRKLFPPARADDGPGEEVSCDEHEAECAPPPHQDAQQYLHCLSREIGAMVARQAGGEDVVRVLADVETLGEQAERVAPDDDAAYDRLQKRQRRTLERLRLELSGDAAGGARGQR